MSDMTEHPNFGILLGRLANHRKMDIGDLPRLAGITETEFQAVLDGAAPSPSLLGRLAPALDLHAADLFVIAEVAVPEELAPLDPTAGVRVPELVRQAMVLPPEGIALVRRFARSLPRPTRVRPATATPVYPPSFGAVVVRLLGNRNLNWPASAKTVFHLTGLALAASTIGAIGHGRKELAPDLLAALATALDISAGDLAALTGVDLPEGTPRPTPPAEVAELIWDARHLSADQVRQARDKAASLHQEPMAENGPGPLRPDGDAGARGTVNAEPDL
jgi:hypothetical protein